jgi:hypothetical protein
VTLEIGFALALASALATNLGFLLKHRGASLSPAMDILRPLATAKSLFSSRWFAIGVAVALFAGLLHVIALTLAPLSLVQAIVAAGVVVVCCSRSWRGTCSATASAADNGRACF